MFNLKHLAYRRVKGRKESKVQENTHKDNPWSFLLHG